MARDGSARCRFREEELALLPRAQQEGRACKQGRALADQAGIDLGCASPAGGAAAAAGTTRTAGTGAVARWAAILTGNASGLRVGSARSGDEKQNGKGQKPEAS